MSIRLPSRARAILVLSAVSAGMLLCPASTLAGPGADNVNVNVDQAKLMKLPERVTSIVVGNPLIADVTLQPGGVVVVTGKSYGATNVIAMDRSGAVLLEREIQVEGPTDRIVTVYRGIDRASYSCTPICQPRVTLGDGDPHFRSTIGQASSLNIQLTTMGSKP
jgi:Pilus formation protein N terminal region